MEDMFVENQNGKGIDSVPEIYTLTSALAVASSGVGDQNASQIMYYEANEYWDRFVDVYKISDKDKSEVERNFQRGRIVIIKKRYSAANYYFTKPYAEWTIEELLEQKSLTVLKISLAPRVNKTPEILRETNLDKKMVAFVNPNPRIDTPKSDLIALRLSEGYDEKDLDYVLSLPPGAISQIHKSCVNLLNDINSQELLTPEYIEYMTSSSKNLLRTMAILAGSLSSTDTFIIPFPIKALLDGSHQISASLIAELPSTIHLTLQTMIRLNRLSKGAGGALVFNRLSDLDNLIRGNNSQLLNIARKMIHKASGEGKEVDEQTKMNFNANLTALGEFYDQLNSKVLVTDVITPGNISRWLAIPNVHNDRRASVHRLISRRWTNLSEPEES